MATGPNSSYNNNSNTNNRPASGALSQPVIPSSRELVQKKRFDPADHIMKLKSKQGEQDYLEVKWRIAWFRDECPQGTIETEMLLLDLDREVSEESFVWNNDKRKSEKVIKTDKGIAVFRATVTDGHGGKATGTKHESAVSFPDFIEKSESGSIGRALAALGYGTQFTGDEFSERHRIVDSPITPVTHPAQEQQQQQLQHKDVSSAPPVAPIMPMSIPTSETPPATPVSEKEPAQVQVKVQEQKSGNKHGLMSDEHAELVRQYREKLSDTIEEWCEFSKRYIPDDDFPVRAENWTDAHAIAFISHYNHWQQQGREEWRQVLIKEIFALTSEQVEKSPLFSATDVKALRNRIALPTEPKAADMDLNRIVFFLNALKDARATLVFKRLADPDGAILKAKPYSVENVLDLYYSSVQPEVRSAYTLQLVKIIVEKKLIARVPEAFTERFNKLREKLVV